MGNLRLDNAKAGSEDFEERVNQFVCFEELADLAAQRIEALVIEGLKIQPGMSEEAAYIVEAKEQEDMKWKRGHSAQLVIDEEVDEQASGGLMGMAISLEDWLQLNAGAENHENTTAIADFHEGSKVPNVIFDENGKRTGTTDLGCASMGEILTLAMLVQLHDPCRNNEPVDAPMMVLVQAERVAKVPPGGSVGILSPKENSEMNGNEKEQEQPFFNITGIHLSGLKGLQGSTCKI